jgi:TP901 family phage tail tape measure protein
MSKKETVGIQIMVDSANGIKSLTNFNKALSKTGTASKKTGKNTDGLSDELDDLKKKAQDGEDAVDNLGDEVEDTGDQVENTEDKVKGLGSSVKKYLGFAALIAGAKKATDSFVEFEDQMLRVKAISGANSKEYDSLTKKAKELGKNTKFSAAEVGKAQEYYAMAGKSVKEINDSLEATLNLAAASGEDLGTVADIVSDSMSSFGWASDRTEEFADILAATAMGANTDVGMMGEAFKYAAPLADTLSISVKDTAKMLGVLANNGIKAGQAGTTLRSAFTRMAAPNDEVNKAFKELNISVTDSKGEFIGMDNTLGLLKGKFNSLTGAQQAAYAKVLFGQEAMTGMLKIINSTSEDTKKLDEALLNFKGTASRTAEEMESGLGGTIRRLKSSASGLAIAVGTMLSPVMEGLTLVMTTASDGLTSLIEGMEKGETGASILAGAVAGLTALYITHKAIAWQAALAEKGFAFSLVGLKTAFFAAKTAVTGFNIAAMANPLFWIPMAVGGIVLLYTKFEKFRNMVNKAGKWVGKIFGVDTAIDTKSGSVSTGVDGSHAGGLSNVPFDGYIAELHQGERVLTKSENKSLTTGSGRAGVSIGTLIGNITINGANKSGKELADEMMGYIVPELKLAINNM